MELLFLEIIDNKKIPKWVRYLMLAVIEGFILFICIGVGLGSEYAVGKIAGLLFAALLFAAGVYVAKRIHKN